MYVLVVELCLNTISTVTASSKHPDRMYYIATTTKTVADAARDLETAVQKHGFGVLHVYDLKEMLTRKGHPLDAECRIYEVCNPRLASLVLRRDMRLNTALPCRISVFEDGGATKIGTIPPTEMLGMLSSDRELASIAANVEATIKTIIDETAGTPWWAARHAARAPCIARDGGRERRCQTQSRSGGPAR